MLRKVSKLLPIRFVGIFAIALVSSVEFFWSAFGGIVGRRKKMGIEILEMLNLKVFKFSVAFISQNIPLGGKKALIRSML